MGVSDDVDRERENRMLGAPLLPVNCPSCQALNRCYREICDSCGTELPEAELPDNLEDSKSPKQQLEERLDQGDIDYEEVAELAEKLKKLGI